MAIGRPLKGVRHAHPVRIPRVYIQEIPSGVRTIAGVATSVAAFVGAAVRGPINKAIRIYSFADFERAFGGLAADSEMSYGVRQFFLNGGTDAWIVRVVKTASPASRSLLTSTATPTLTVTALDSGASGNDIQLASITQRSSRKAPSTSPSSAAAMAAPRNTRTSR